jgi:spermidine/putrescine-binding protein
MIISLMNSLLTGLNENNEELGKRVFYLCDKMNKKYGYLWIDGAVWVNILKSSKVRIAGFKYFMKVFKDRDRINNLKE